MVWKVKGTGDPVKEVWEDFYGNLWFVTEKGADGIDFGYARLYQCPEFAEWGSWESWSNADNIKKTYATQFMIWKVKNENWENIWTYEKDLLVEVK